MTRSKLRTEAQKKLDKLNFDALEHMVAVVLHPNCDLQTKCMALKTILQYSYEKIPELVSLDVQVERVSPDSQAYVELVRSDPRLRALNEELIIAAAQRQQEQRLLVHGPETPHVPALPGGRLPDAD